MSVTGLSLGASGGFVLLLMFLTIYQAMSANLEQESNFQSALAIAHAYHHNLGRCALTSDEVELATARRALSRPDLPPPENESEWRLRFEGDSNRRLTMTVYRVDADGNAVESHSHTMSPLGGNRGQDFLDLSFSSRVCP